MGVDELLKRNRSEILRLAAEHGAHNVRLFGSVARGEARPDSDVGAERRCPLEEDSGDAG